MSNGPVDTRLEVALEVLRAARPFVEAEVRRSDSTIADDWGMKPNDLLERIDGVLAVGWPAPAPLPADYWETAQ